MNKLNYKLINIGILILILYFLYKTNIIWINIFTTIKKIVLPFIISFLLSYILYPIVKYLKKKKINHFLSSLIVVIILFIIIFLILYYTVPIITKEIIEFSSNILSYKDKLINNEYLKTLILKITNLISKNSINIITKSASIMTKLVFIVILTIYFLFNIEKIKEIIISFIKNKKYYNLIKEIDIDLNKYIKSISIILIIEFIEYTILYLIIGHPNYLLLGLLAGLANIIPYFGSLFTNVIALITAYKISNKLFILTSLIALITPVIDNYLIDPKVIKYTTKISPIKTIIALTISNTIFGFIGMLLAIPLYIVIEKIIKYIVKEKELNNN